MPLSDESTYEIIDGQSRRSRTAMGIIPLTAGNFTAVNTAVAAYEAAINALIDGDVAAYNVIHNTAVTPAPPSDGDIMRGRKWAVTLQDGNTHRLFVVTIPTAKLTAVTDGLADSSGNAIVGATPWVNYIAAVNNADMAGPGGGQPSFVRARLVTRRA